MNIEVTQKADGWMLGTIEGGYEWQATAAIDVEAQETYLQSQGTDTSEMDETALAQANTGSKVFIASNVKFVDAMEDLKLTCNM